ncbi:hypothetical protein [Pseudonocardia spinosispora]|uniref:hypothetical protein n=1 Tax=Pseudonocardia spinosispora TaxID=103441 RepID=UPI0012EB9AD6|nr:hypothetical protein [Pseudonocardia spinosispora]
MLSQQPLRLSEVRRIGSQIADALARGHAQGAPHGGVSPSTIRVGADGRARLAAPSGRPPEDAYVSPEYVRGEQVGPAADVYALGLVLLEAISGRQVYPGSGRAAAEARLDAPPLVPNDVPGPMARALLAMTETLPSARPTASRAAAMLAGEAVVEQAPVAATGPSAGKIAAIGLPVLVLLVLLGVALWGSGSADTTGGVSPDSTTRATATPTHSATRTATPTSAPTKTSTSGKPTHTTSRETPGFTMPSLPTKLPDLPDKPEIPSSVTDKAESLWTEIKDWFGKFFG